jgi:hypothetical protein
MEVVSRTAQLEIIQEQPIQSQLALIVTLLVNLVSIQPFATLAFLAIAYQADYVVLLVVQVFISTQQ